MPLRTTRDSGLEHAYQDDDQGGLRLPGALTRRYWRFPVTLVDSSSPWLMTPRPDDLCPGNLILQPTQLPGTPPSQPGAISKLSNSDEGDNSWPTFEEWSVSRGQ